MVTFAINIPQMYPNVSIYTIHGSYGIYIYTHSLSIDFDVVIISCVLGIDGGISEEFVFEYLGLAMNTYRIKLTRNARESLESQRVTR